MDSILEIFPRKERALFLNISYLYFHVILFIDFCMNLKNILFFYNRTRYFKTSVLMYVQISNIKSSLLSPMEVVFTSLYACFTKIRLKV
jgi:hypothetical protein